MHDKVIGAALPAPLALAYLGDAVYSLFVRHRLIGEGYEKSGALNEEALHYVSAEAQAAHMRRIEPYLAEDERDVFRRAANSTKLRRSKHASGAEYRLATGFEAVLGMLYWLGDRERIDELLALAEGATPDVTNENTETETVKEDRI